MSSKSILPVETTLTVVIRDDAPLIHVGDPVFRRSVSIKLTREQVEQLRLRYSHTSSGVNFYEQIAMCFLEAKERKDGE